MSRIFRYAVILIPLLILVIYLLRERSPFGSSNTSFAVTPKTGITGIEMSDGKQKLLLEKKGDDWIVNKSYEARKSSILFISEILTELQIKSPVDEDLFEKEIVEKNIKPVVVKVTEKGRTLRTFLVYKTRSNIYGNIMKMRERSKPYIVSLPGTDADIGSSFTLNEHFWRPFTIFNLMPSEISSVVLNTRADSSASFRIEKWDNSLRLFSMDKELTGWDTSQVTRYLSYFTHVAFESWALDLPDEEKNDIKSDIPFYIITVGLKNGDSSVLRLWQRSVEEDGIFKIDTDRLWGEENDIDELFVVRYVDIDPILKKVSYFFTQ
jgi:hypothetical protein